MSVVVNSQFNFYVSNTYFIKYITKFTPYNWMKGDVITFSKIKFF